jgi:hypothetical protein
MNRIVYRCACTASPKLTGQVCNRRQHKAKAARSNGATGRRIQATAAATKKTLDGRKEEQEAKLAMCSQIGRSQQSTNSGDDRLQTINNAAAHGEEKLSEGRVEAI